VRLADGRQLEERMYPPGHLRCPSINDGLRCTERNRHAGHHRAQAVVAHQTMDGGLFFSNGSEVYW
jgi:hypothetical protein